jgi:hypothetical protein
MGFILLGCSLFLARPALAASAKERVAKKACLSGDYVKGVSILAQLFVDTNDSTFLYNQGRCYEQNVRYWEAAERFREYLRKAGKLSAEERADVDKHIADCEAASRRAQPQAASAASPEPVPTVVPQSSAAPEPHAQNIAPPQPVVSPPPSVPPPVTTVAQTAPPPEGQTWQHTAKWIATGAAVAFLGLAIGEHVNYYGKNHDYNDDPNCGAATDVGRCHDLASSANTAQLVAIVGYGAAAVATGLALTFWLTDRPVAQTQRAGFSLTCTPALAGMSCAGRF